MVALAFSSTLALAGDDADRTKLMGTWQSPNDGGSWVLADKGDVVHITRLEKNQKVSDFECNTRGQECDIKDLGKSVKISMWFNGPKLVLMETRGSDVLKRRFQATGDQLELEVIPIVPAGKPETEHLNRAAGS
jgi:hypothetical protein